MITHDLTSVDMLYAVNTKKEPAATKSPGFANELLPVTSSTISISNLLELVNRYYPDVISKDVLNHFGRKDRPKSELSDDIKYQDRDGGSESNKKSSSQNVKEQTKYQLRKDIDGETFVDVDSDIIKESDGRSIASVIAEIIKNKFNNLIETNNQLIRINATTNREWRRSNDATRDAMIKNYDGTSNVDTYAREFIAYNNYGRLGYNQAAIPDNLYSLTDNARAAAYNSGAIEAETNLKARSVLSKAQQRIRNQNNGFRKGTVNMSAIENIRLTENQKDSVEYVNKAAEYSGFNVEWFKSEADADGNVITPENGSYNSATNTIRLDINAGQKNIKQALTQGAVISTFSHELTHIAENAPDEYLALRKAVVKVLGNKAWQNAVDKQSIKLKENHPENTSNMTDKELEEYAATEALAEYCSNLLKDSDLVEQLARENPSLKAKLKKLLDKVISAIRSLRDRIRENYGATNAYTAELDLKLHKLNKARADILSKWEAAVKEGIKTQNARTAAPESNKKSSSQNVQEQARNISQNDIKVIQAIGRKSIFDFTSKEISLTEPWARAFWNTIGTKSPFFRAWFGDWRANDSTKIKVATIKGDNRGVVKNKDTDWNINVSAKVFNESSSHNSYSSRAARVYLPYINDIISKAVLLDSHTSDKTRSQNSLFFHSFYSVADIGNGKELLKLIVEEIYNPNSSLDIFRSYKLVNIEKSSVSAEGSQINVSPVTKTDDIDTISDLFQAVKQHDKHFNPVSASKVVDSNGEPLVVYHGTNADFTVFDRKKIGLNYRESGNSEYGGFFFTDRKSSAENFSKDFTGNNNSKVMESYLQIVNPYEIEAIDYYDAVDKFDLNSDEIIREALENGNDGIIISSPDGSLYIVFESNQIKSATDNIGTFDKNNPDIRYQDRDGGSESELLANSSLTRQAMDFDDWISLDDFDDIPEDKIRFDKMLKDNPVEALRSVMQSGVKAATEALKLGVELDERALSQVSNKVAKDFMIDKSAVSKIGEAINEYFNAVKNGVDSVEAFESFYQKARDIALEVNIISENVKERRSRIKSVLKDNILDITAEQLPDIISHYDSYKNFREAMASAGLRVRQESNAKRDIYGRAKGGSTVNDIIISLNQELGYDIYAAANGVTSSTDGTDAIIELEEFLTKEMNEDGYYNPYLEGEAENLDLAAAELAFDAMKECIYRQGISSTRKGNINLVKKYKALHEKSARQYKALKAAERNLHNEQTKLNRLRSDIESLNKDYRQLSELDKQLTAAESELVVDDNKIEELRTQRQAAAERYEKASKALNRRTHGMSTMLKNAQKEAVKAEQAKWEGKLKKVREEKNAKINDLIKDRQRAINEAAVDFREKYRDARTLTEVVNRIKKLGERMGRMLTKPNNKLYVPSAFRDTFLGVCNSFIESMETDKDTEVGRKLSDLKNLLAAMNEGSQDYSEY